MCFWGGEPMHLLPRVEDCGPFARRLRERGGSSDRNKTSIRSSMLAVAVLVGGTLLGFNQSAKANDLASSGDSIAAARSYVQLNEQPQSPAKAENRQKFAEADSLFGAINKLIDQPDGSTKEEPAAAPPRYTGPVGESPRPNAVLVGSRTCLGCHTNPADSFGHTLMGRIAAQGEGKLDCETCHGPGSVHVRSAGCAACHGEGGVSTRSGMPSLAGLAPEYIVSAVQSFATGKRHDEFMGPIGKGISGAELNKVAHYYAGQTPARAQTRPVGDALAGKAAAASCAGCHGERGVSSNPQFPSLAGQDARYLAAKTRDYKNGKNKDPIMAPMAAALEDRQIDNVATYYASLQPARPGGASGGPVPAAIGVGRGANGESQGGIISFRSDDPSRTPEQNNVICLNCHERGERAQWRGSVHEVRGLACTNCHTVMKSVSAKFQLKTAFQPDTCFQCHKDRRAQMFRSSHMPMREGKIVCSDCHNPHGSVTEKLIRENSVNDNCYKCHAEKRGPFLWEHAPVRENCLACHDPHGSINEFSLKMSRPRLCFECHTVGHAEQSGKNSTETMGRACQNCHQMIHGSNSPAGAALQR